MSIQRRALYLAIFAAATQIAVAQEFVENGSFDLDAAPWVLPPLGAWSNVENHGGSVSGADSGSLELTTSTSVAASQCVPVSPGTTYVLKAWIELDPLREFDPCVMPNANLGIEWYSDSECLGNKVFSIQQKAKVPVPFGWYEATFVSTSPIAANGANIQLNDFCSTQQGTSLFYFDDVSFQPDAVFQNDFELHAPEGGPGSG